MKTIVLFLCFLAMAVTVSAQRSPTWEQMTAQQDNERASLYLRHDSELQFLLKTQEYALERLSGENLKAQLAEKHIAERQKLSERQSAERMELAKLHHAERTLFGKPSERPGEPKAGPVGELRLSRFTSDVDFPFVTIYVL